MQNNSEYEEELSFVILSENPEQIINKIRNTETVENYELKNKKKTIQITDTYYDVSKNILQKNKFALRIRIEEYETYKKKFIALKGPIQINETDNPIRLEIEKEWNLIKIKPVFTELEKLIPWINTHLNEVNFYSGPHHVLKKKDFMKFRQE